MPLAELTPTQASHRPPAASEWNEAGAVPFWRCGVLLALTLVTLAVYWIKPPVSLPPKAGVIMTLPDNVKITLPNQVEANFHGFAREMSPAELNGLPQDTGFTRKEYDDFAGDNIFCTIVLSGAEQRSIHRPEGCLAGQGWSIIGQEDLPIRLDSGHTLVVRNLSIQRDFITSTNEHHIIHGYYIYWFVGEKVTTPSHITRILLSSWDRVVHSRAHRWAYVSVLAPMTDSLRPGGFDADQTRTMLADFIRKIVPSFQIAEMADQPSSP